MAQVMLSATMGNPFQTVNISPGHGSADVLEDYGSLPTLLSSKAFSTEKHSVLPGGNSSKPLAAPKGGASGPAQTIVLKSTTTDSAEKKEEEKQVKADAEMKGFAAGAHVEYYSKSHGEWIPAIIGDVRPNGCLKLLHDDGSVLKKEADSNSVRLAREQAKQGYDTRIARPSSQLGFLARSCLIRDDEQAKFNTSLSDPSSQLGFLARSCLIRDDEQAKSNTSLSDRTLAMCSRAASEGYDEQAKFNTGLSVLAGIKQVNAEQSSSEALGSKEAYDQQMKFLHSRSEKCNAQLQIHRGLSEGMAPDQQLEFSHLEFRHSLNKAIGPTIECDMANLMHSSDQLMRQMNFRHGLSSMYDQ